MVVMRDLKMAAMMEHLEDVKMVAMKVVLTVVTMDM